MAQQSGVKSVVVEFIREGPEAGVYDARTCYTRTVDDDGLQSTINPGISSETFETNLNILRYSTATPQQVEAALTTFESEAASMLCNLPSYPETTTHIDVVSAAGELWAFPFEAYVRSRHGVVVTRRIRNELRNETSWPPEPRVLFAHAALDSDQPDLTEEDVNSHIAALSEALLPWTGGADPIGTHLFVQQLHAVRDLEKARTKDFTHIHLLAHGKEVPIEFQRPVWGMRLGPKATAGTHPRDVAAALMPRNGLPVAVTIASCDSANQANPGTAAWSIAQAIHRLGIPVVVASQLPLTMSGSALLTKHFYDSLFCGDDVRIALDHAREALRNDAAAHHDWLSIVAYLRLSKTYEEQLTEVALKMELSKLRAIQKRADEAIKLNDQAALRDIGQLMGQRIVSLDDRLRGLQGEKQEKNRFECQGLLASAYKRQAEVLFRTEAEPNETRLALENSLKHYSEVFAAAIHMHWHGVQQIALQAALHGRYDPLDHAIVMRSAEAAANAQNSEFWPYGTMVELHLLDSRNDPAALAKAKKAMQNFKDRVNTDEGGIDSTRRQLLRYVDWWTQGNGFAIDLGVPAAALAAMLT